MNTKLINKAKDYFKYFQKKDLKSLSNMFENKILLLDWENKIKGKKKNINFLKSIFKTNTFNIKIENFYLHNTKNIISCQILIKFKNKKKIRVLDVIKFNKKLKITKIEAYKC